MVERVERELLALLKKGIIGPDVPNKLSFATHFMWKEGVNYYSLNYAKEQHLLSLLARAHDTGVTTFVHEVFTDKFALVFDVDSKDPNLHLRPVLANIYECIRSFFEIESSSINCIVFTASSETKSSYHIHFPDVIVSKQICKIFYEELFQKDKKLRDIIDEQIIGSKLRLPFSDKYNTETHSPLGRKLIYYGAFNHRCQRYNPEWESDTYEVLSRSTVRRESTTELTSLRVSLKSIDMLTTNHFEDNSLDFDFYDEKDFVGLPPSYYSFCKMQIVVDFIHDKYQMSGKEMCTKIVKYMNNFVAMITDMPGKTIFMIKTYNNERKMQTFSYVQKSHSDFLCAFQHIKVLVFVGDGERKAFCKSIGEIWMKHNEKRTLGKIVFDPRPNSTNAVGNLNLFQGMEITPEHCSTFVEERGIDYRQRIRLILDHIRDVWCAGNTVVYEYVIKWIAHALIRPWIKMGVALVLIGSEGCGKSMMINAIGKCFGSHYHQLTDMEDLVGRFTAPLATKMFVFADEAFFGGCKSSSGKLKGLITEQTIRCEHKGFDTIWLDSFSNFVFASNHWHAVPAGLNARRWMCLGCSSHKNRDTNYFTSLSECIYGDDMCGLKCFVHFLATDVDLTNFKYTLPPMTSLLRSQKENSFDSLESWWDQVLHRGYVIAWEDYEMVDSTFQHDRKDIPGLVRYFAGHKYGYQMLPLQTAFNQYCSEMKNSRKVFHYQRFRQFLKDKNCYKQCPPPRKDRHKETWIIVHFEQARDEWRKVFNDPDMTFESDVVWDNDDNNENV